MTTIDTSGGAARSGTVVRVWWARVPHLEPDNWTIHFHVTEGAVQIRCDLYVPEDSTREDWYALAAGRPVSVCRGALVSDGTSAFFRTNEEGGDNDRTLTCTVPLEVVARDLRAVLDEVADMGMRFAGDAENTDSPDERGCAHCGFGAEHNE